MYVTEGIHVLCYGSKKFGWVEQPRILQFNSAESGWTTVQHMEPDLVCRLTWVQGCSTLPNLVKPQYNTKNIESGVPLDMSSGWFNSANPAWSNQSTTHVISPGSPLDMNSKWFNSAEPDRITVQHMSRTNSRMEVKIMSMESAILLVSRIESVEGWMLNCSIISNEMDLE